MENLNVFYFRVISSASTDLYPENTLANFTNTFPLTLKTHHSEGWRVALDNIVCSNNFLVNNKIRDIQVFCDQITPQLGQFFF